MAATRQPQFLGSGWRFPVAPTALGRLAFSQGALRVAESIWLILSTAPGERVMRPEFGCGIHELVFAPNDEATHGEVTERVREALTRYEPRIDLEDVRVEAAAGEPNKLLIRVDYRLRATNAAHNLVYPFYIAEGGAP